MAKDKPVKEVRTKPLSSPLRLTRRTPVAAEAVTLSLEEEHDLLAKIRQLSRERVGQLREIIEGLLDDEEDERDIRARLRLVRRASIEDAEL